MRVVLRADASFEIGTGHVMRQLALAEELLLQEAEVFLVGDILGPSWLDEKLASLEDLQRVIQPIGTFDSGILWELGATISTIDSYAIEQRELAEWESHSSTTLVFIDGPWQRLEGRTAVVPAISDSFAWIGGLRGSFDSVYAGPEFLMIRSEIRRAKWLRSQHPPLSPQILLVLGGANMPRLVSILESALSQFSTQCRVVVFTSDRSGGLSLSHVPTPSGLSEAPRSSFAEELAKSTLVISAAGTTTGELLFLGVPSIFVPVVDNQRENAMALEAQYSSVVLWPELQDFEGKLVSTVSDMLEQWRSSDPLQNPRVVTDGLGARRVAGLLLHRTANPDKEERGPESSS